MPRGIAVAYAVAGVLLVAYAATLLLRQTGQFWPVLDNWGVDAFEVGVALLCLARACPQATGPRRRPRHGTGTAGVVHR